MKKKLLWPILDAIFAVTGLFVSLAFYFFANVTPNRLLQTARTLPETLDMLKEKGFSDSTSVVVNCGLPGEQKYPNLLEFETALLEAPESTYSYFTLLIVKPTEEST